MTNGQSTGGGVFLTGYGFSALMNTGEQIIVQARNATGSGINYTSNLLVTVADAIPVVIQ